MSTRLRLLLICVVLSTHLVVVSTEAHACQPCLGIITPEEWLAQADAVFAGRVVWRGIPPSGLSGLPDTYFQEYDGDPLLFNDVEVYTIWKGPSVATFRVEDASCGIHFDLHSEYLIYAYESNGELEAVACSPTTWLSQADLSLLGTGHPAPEGGIYPPPPTTAFDSLPLMIMGGFTGFTSAAIWYELWFYCLVELI